MDIPDPALVVGGAAVVAIALAMVASRLIASATAELTDPDPELSRIRPRS